MLPSEYGGGDEEDLQDMFMVMKSREKGCLKSMAMRGCFVMRRMFLMSRVFLMRRIRDEQGDLIEELGLW